MFNAGWPRNPSRVAAAQTCSASEKRLPCCQPQSPDRRTCNLCKASGKLHGKKNKKQRPLEEVLREFQGKVIEAAQKLQQELSDSAAQPAVDGSTTAADEDPPVLAWPKERQRKRATETETQDQRPVAKPKAGKRQSKRTACTAFGSSETPASESAPDSSSLPDSRPCSTAIRK